MEGLALASIPHAAALLGPLAPVGIVWIAVFLALGYTRIKAAHEELPFRYSLFGIHLALMAVVYVGNRLALHTYRAQLLHSTPAHLLWTSLTLAAIVLLIFAAIPIRAWAHIFRETHRLWLYSTVAGALAWCLRFPLQSMWDSSTSIPGRFLQVIAFHSVNAVLRIFIPNILVDPVAFRVGTPRFMIIIAEACSGLEGLGLVLVFTVCWLWYFRRESRFPQAFLLIPCALLSVWALNILRICALVLIGNAGYHDVAMVGFHSQAGWIAFTSVAFAFSMATRKLAWVSKVHPAHSGIATAANPTVSPAPPSEQTSESPATASYLLPFLGILAASFLSKAASGYFEWLYPLRFVTAAIAIRYAWPEIRKLKWKFSWPAPLTGALIFAIWIAPSVWTTYFATGAPSSPIEPGPTEQGLFALTPAARFIWILFRIAAAVLTVPIAEELAFRGYLARRILDRNFETVPFTTLTLVSILVSSLAFGLMHGQHWIVGTIAGIAFALVLRWRGRIGDAVVAHATSNLLLAVWVLSRGDWSQW